MNNSESPTPPPPPARADATRAALIDAGLRLFGQHGFDATTTRRLAKAAGANVAAIGYHFGGKEALRTACAEHCAARILDAIRPALPADRPVGPPADRETARRLLRAMAAAMVSFMVATPEAGHVSGFLLREMTEGGPGIGIVYAALVEPMHGRACALWAAATGQQADAPAVRLAVFALIGQIVYFRIGRPVILRRMGWDGVGAPEAAQITRLILANLDALLAAGGRE
ncbi:MAG: CerR family C-terminal domain-containing protein [Paracoccaceae bacterium]